jgi:hypothetical protein
VGAASLLPTARALERRGCSCRVPTPAHNPENPPPWREWLARLCDALPTTDKPIVAAHSAAGLLLPSLAEAVDASMLIFVDVVEVPEWRERRCGYLRLSKTYGAEAADAKARGWPVIHIDGTHFHPAIEPEQTAEALLAAVAAIDGDRS